MSKTNANGQQPLNKLDQENIDPWYEPSQSEFVQIIEAVIKNYGGLENLMEQNPQLGAVFAAMESSAIFDCQAPKEEKHIAETVIDKLIRETDELLGQCE